MFKNLKNKVFIILNLRVLLLHHFCSILLVFFNPLLLIIGYFWGVFLGYVIGHRYIGHRLYEKTIKDKIIHLVYVIFLGQSSPASLAYIHRLHHKYSDTEKDPHSPKYIGKFNVYVQNWKLPSKIERNLYKDYFNDKFQKFLLEYYEQIHLIFFLFFIIFINFDLGLALFSFARVVNFHYSGIINTFCHSNEGPINNNKLKYINPFGWNHKDHHEIEYPGKKAINNV